MGHVDIKQYKTIIKVLRQKGGKQIVQQAQHEPSLNHIKKSLWFTLGSCWAGFILVC
jgi:hypothetical protein